MFYFEQWVISGLESLLTKEELKCEQYVKHCFDVNISAIE